MNTFNCRVYYEDTDAGGIVYYANYLKFIERARTECLRNLGVSQSFVKKKHGLVFVVKKICAEYCVPAKLDDLLEIKTVPCKIARVSFEVEQEILVEEKMIFKAQVKLGMIDSQGKPKKIPDSIKDKIGYLGKKMY
tara:strand:+ start:210 stop:617 length:408 start_codon:yes stop_codon:yes gene_type:complete